MKNNATSVGALFSVRWLHTVLNRDSSQLNRVRYAVRRGPQNPFRHLRFCRGCPVSDSNLLYRHIED